MSSSRLIVIGASAGGVEALTHLVSALPADLPASVFVVVHIPHDATSVLPRILSRSGPLEAVHAIDGDEIVDGRIYVAPPNNHMLVNNGTVTTMYGPRENGHRPAVDPLFRSAARAHGNRVIGVILTGNLDDGTAGLQSIKSYGGVAIVQDPAEAIHPGMPRSAVRNVDVDHVLPLGEIVPTLLHLLAIEPPANGDHMPSEADSQETARELRVGDMIMGQLNGDDQPGEPSGFSCPECDGVLWQIEHGRLLRYRCRVGHAYTADSLLTAQGSYVEAALWAALRSLEENAAFARRLARRAEGQKLSGVANRFQEQADRTTGHANAIRDVLVAGPVHVPSQEDSVVAPE